MQKEELRDKLLVARQQYLDKNSKRIEKLKPYWDAIQKNIPELKNIEPYIDFCDGKDACGISKQDLWWYGRVTVSSAPLSGEVGRRIHYLVRDRNTGFILGIVGLASDLTIPIRDKYIGWTHANKWDGKKINYLMNIQHCVATEPYNEYLTGKLCALSAKSVEVQDYFENRYKHKIAAMTVTSLYGKSSMYNRLEGFEYLGTTKGYSSLLIPIEIKNKMRDDYKATKGKHSETYYNEDGSIRTEYGVVKGYQKLSKYIKVQSIENFRGVYLVPLVSNYKEFLCEKESNMVLTNHEKFDIIISRWKERWFLPRIQRRIFDVVHESDSKEINGD